MHGNSCLNNQSKFPFMDIPNVLMFHCRDSFFVFTYSYLMITKQTSDQVSFATHLHAAGTNSKVHQGWQFLLRVFVDFYSHSGLMAG